MQSILSENLSKYEIRPGISWMAAMICDVVVFRRWAHAPVIHVASHFYREKRVAWVSISMHTCDPVPIVMGLRLAAFRAAGAPLLYYLNLARFLSIMRRLLSDSPQGKQGKAKSQV